jgi:hypothetical protein
MITESQYEYLVSISFGSSLDSIWAAVSSETFMWDGTRPTQLTNFTERRIAFFWILERLLVDGKLKMGDNPLLLTRDRNQPLVPENYLARGSIEEQINQLKQSFPRTEANVDMGGAGVWFFTLDCPYAAVWVHEDGELDWG